MRSEAASSYLASFPLRDKVFSLLPTVNETDVVGLHRGTGLGSEGYTFAILGARNPSYGQGHLGEVHDKFLRTLGVDPSASFPPVGDQSTAQLGFSPSHILYAEELPESQFGRGHDGRPLTGDVHIFIFPDVGIARIVDAYWRARENKEIRVVEEIENLLHQIPYNPRVVEEIKSKFPSDSEQQTRTWVARYPYAGL